MKSAPNAKAAQTLINFLLSPDTQLLIAEGTIAAPVNRKVTLPPAREAEVPHGDVIDGMIHIDRVTMNRDLDNRAAMWNQQIQAKA